MNCSPLRKPKAKGSRLKKLTALLALALLMSLPACGRVNTAYRPPIDQDVIERATNSLPFDVQEFTWAYMPDGRGLKVSGTIKNNGPATQRAVIYALLFDEEGIGTAMGQTTAHPPVLAPEQTGRFTLLVATSRPRDERPLRHLRLLTNTQNR